jgi:hypothetical protein
VSTSNVEIIKKLLKLSDIEFIKSKDEQVIHVKVKNLDKVFLFIAPDCEDGEYIRVSELTEPNPIVNFTLMWEHSECSSVLAPVIAKAFALASEYLIQLEKEWIGKDVKDFAASTIKVQDLSI